MGGNCGGGGGTIDVTGSLIVENFCFSGNANFEHDSVMDDVELDIDLDTIKYLHVSENTVEVELE
jgi:hypothetical protein